MGERRRGVAAAGDNGGFNSFSREKGDRSSVRGNRDEGERRWLDIVVVGGEVVDDRPSMKEVSQILRRCGPVEGSEGKKARREYDVAPLLDSATYLSSYRRSDEDDDSVACIV
ncbi:hypothetical protein LOK49_LG13G02334 [Camellia lanceoleosa]|uniref:Uncharacterized protein n=1 Tax=Camellia lanceoleosa TaxID=1840588 RepID=A0ACC0FLT8_9ERIC|nr:hypothetical protein LOK49_LG13G02334 [Camellia lanceoleosa]